MTAPQNPPAFPSDLAGDDYHSGMTLRDWFAGQFAAVAAVEGLKGYDHLCEETLRRTARNAYALADAMLAARPNKETDQ